MHNESDDTMKAAPKSLGKVLLTLYPEQATTSGCNNCTNFHDRGAEFPADLSVSTPRSRLIV